MTILHTIYWMAAAITIGSLAYCAIALFAALRFMRARHRASEQRGGTPFTPAVSLIKPLYGLDRELERNLRSFCRQNYPSFELLFSVRDTDDAAVAVVRRLQTEFPNIAMRLLLTGQPRYWNAKVDGLEAMAAAAAFDVLVISDSDVRVSPDYLAEVVAPLADTGVGMATCISRGVAGRSLWSRLEALSMNTQFVPGVLSAWVLLGIEFSLGPTMVIRKYTLAEIGGFGSLGDYLADDFVLGERVVGSGQTVALAFNVPDHLVCNEELSSSLRHRLRWERSSRRSRPSGYLGQIFMHTLPLALLAFLTAPRASTLATALLIAALSTRALLALVTCCGVLRDRDFRRDWWLLPIQDLMSFGVWCWGFFGKEIEWRGARFRVQKGGKLEAASDQVRAAPASIHAD